MTPEKLKFLKALEAYRLAHIALVTAWGGLGSEDCDTVNEIDYPYTDSLDEMAMPEWAEEVRSELMKGEAPQALNLQDDQEPLKAITRELADASRWVFDDADDRGETRGDNGRGKLFKDWHRLNKALINAENYLNNTQP